MRASSSASPGGIDNCWSTKWEMPACLAPGTSVSPSASRRRDLFRCECAKRDILRARLPRREQNFGAARAERERAQCRALHEGAPFDLGHQFLPACCRFLIVVRAALGAPRRLWNEMKSNPKSMRGASRLARGERAAIYIQFFDFISSADRGECAIRATAWPLLPTARPSSDPRRAGSSGTAPPRANSPRRPAA